VQTVLDGERRFGCRGFSLYGKTNVSTMVGTIQADYDMADVNTVQLLPKSTDLYNQISV